MQAKSDVITHLKRFGLDLSTLPYNFLLTCPTLRWSETKNLKISIPDNIFFLSLIIIKLCTLKQLANVHQKLKLQVL